jgi:hypothetical protein
MMKVNQKRGRKMLDFLAVYGKQKKEIDGEIISHLTQKPVDQATFAYQNANYILSQNRDRLFLFLTDKDPQKILARTGGGGKKIK